MASPGAGGSTTAKSRRYAFLLLALAALAFFALLGPKWPKDHDLRVILGNLAPTVEEVQVRYAERGSEELVREVTFRYPKGGAPRIVSHEPRLPDGDYLVEIDLGFEHGHAETRRTVTLGGGSTSIDVSQLASSP
jgi:hypothetical protein